MPKKVVDCHLPDVPRVDCLELSLILEEFLSFFMNPCFVSLWQSSMTILANRWCSGKYVDDSPEIRPPNIRISLAFLWVAVALWFLFPYYSLRWCFWHFASKNPELPEFCCWINHPLFAPGIYNYQQIPWSMLWL